MMNCIAVEDEPLALKLLQDNISKVPFLKLVAACNDAFVVVETGGVGLKSLPAPTSNFAFSSSVMAATTALTDALPNIGTVCAINGDCTKKNRYSPEISFVTGILFCILLILFFTQIINSYFLQ